jgi:hypothetical protein
VAVLLQRLDQGRQQRPQPFAADPIQVERRFGARRRTPGFRLLAILLFQRRRQRACSFASIVLTASLRP